MKDVEGKRKKAIKRVRYERKRYRKSILCRSRKGIYSYAPQIAAVEYLCIVLSDCIGVMTERELDVLLAGKCILEPFYDSWRIYEDTLAQNMEKVVLHTMYGLITNDGRDSE